MLNYCVAWWWNS